MPEEKKREKPLKVVLPAVGELPAKVVKRKPGRPPKNGAYSGIELVPITIAKRDEIIKVMAKAHVPVNSKYMIAINLLAGNLAMIELISRAITVEGVITADKDGNMIAQPLLKVYWSALNSAMRQCVTLGLTPDKLVKGSPGPVDMAAGMAEEKENDD